MKKAIAIFLLSAACLCAQAQSEGWAAYMMPGIVHKQLSSYVGPLWRAKLTLWVAAEAQPESFDLQASIEPLMDGRFFRIRCLGEIRGMRYEALDELGFDNITQTFTHIAYSTFGTSFTVTEGTWNDARKTAALKGRTIGPEDKNWTGLRETVKFIDREEIIFELYELREGQKEFKSAELLLYKKK